MTTPSTRVSRLCDICGKLDDHPRHVQAVPPGTNGTVPTDDFLDTLPDNTPARSVAELMDPTTLIRHMDCCAAAGCLTCRAVNATHDGLTGDALVAHLESGAVDHLSDSNKGV